MKKLCLFVGFSWLLVSAEAGADSISPYTERCVADATGRYYVVVKRNDDDEEERPDCGPVTVTIAEKRQGSPPVRSQSALGPDGTAFLARVDPRIRVRDGDIVHGHIKLDHPPRMILVSSTGRGIVTLDAYGYNDVAPNAGQNDIVIYSINGECLHRKPRNALFAAKYRQLFRRERGFFIWLDSAWIDEKRNEVVIVGAAPEDRPHTRPLITVGLKSGEVREAGLDAIELAIIERNPQALTGALDLAKDLHLRQSAQTLGGIVGDLEMPLSGRLRAAILLGQPAGRQTRELIATTILMGTEPTAGSEDFEHQEDVYYAIEHCVELLGRDALPLLIKVLLKNGETFSHGLCGACALLGKMAVPDLISVLEDERNLGGQLEAANCLAAIGPEAEQAVPALIKALKSKAAVKQEFQTRRLDEHAARALDGIGKAAKPALPELERLAKDPDRHVRDSALQAIVRIRRD